MIQISSPPSTVAVTPDGQQLAYCPLGLPIAISSDPAITQIELDDQPAGTPAKFTPASVTLHERGLHEFLLHLADGSTAALRLFAHGDFNNGDS